MKLFSIAKTGSVISLFATPILCGLGFIHAEVVMLALVFFLFVVRTDRKLCM